MGRRPSWIWSALTKPAGRSSWRCRRTPRTGSSRGASTTPRDSITWNSLRGDGYEKLRPVYVISFLDYRLRHEDESLWDTDRFISHWRFIEKRTGEVADQTISVIFVEMALFTKGPEACETESDRLFYIFRNGGGFDRIPEWIEKSGGVSRRLAEACEVAAFSKEKKQQYEDENMNERDIRAQREYAVRVSREEGRQEEKISIAKKMFEIGTPIDVVISCTGIDKAAAEALSEHS